MKRIASLCALGLFAACTRSDPDPGLQLAALVSDERNVVVDLAKLDGSEWQRICFLPPYSDTAAAGRILGFEWDSDRYTSIRSSDTTAVVVLVSDEKVVHFAEHPRSLGDLSDVGTDCLERADAKLTRKRDPDGWIRLSYDRGPNKSLERTRGE